jgi:ribonucleoside-diphosphate reductase beta chain
MAGGYIPGEGKSAPVVEATCHGDPGPGESETPVPDIELLGPQPLYELWERQHWQVQRIDFFGDTDDWKALPERAKDEVLWALSPFFIGEERVATQFSGLVMAYEDEQEEAFLATQQVDEARHMQFFDRFFREVVGLEHDAIGKRLQWVREGLTEAFGRLFDEALVDAGEKLVADPTDLGAKVDFVTTYHMVIEGALALTGQRFIADHFERERILPGFVEGLRHVARDEHRHIAYGAWFLRRAVLGDEGLRERIQLKLGELLPVAARVFVPPTQHPRNARLLGYAFDELNEFALRSVSRRLKAIGVPLGGEPVPA